MIRSSMSSLLWGLVILLACSNDSMPSPERPDTDDLVQDEVIYEVFVRSFTPEGTFRAVIPRLPELKALGATVLWLMPIHPIGMEGRKGTLGSPYAIQDYFAVNPDFGTKEDFRVLVEAVHAEDMKLIIDFVANHTAWDNAWVTEHPEWYTRDAQGKMQPPVPDWSDVADLNYEVPAVSAEMRRAMRYWVEEFDIDGYRCDVAEMVPGEFWQEAIAELRQIKPVLMLAEGASPDLYEQGFDLTYAWDPYHRIKEVWRGASFGVYAEAIQSERETYPDLAHRLRFTTNHDESAWDATPVELFGGVKGAQAAMVATSLLPGVPLVYNGQEVADTTRLGLFEKMNVRWDTNPEMRQFYAGLLAFRAESLTIRRGTITFLAHPAQDDVLMFLREYDGEHLLVAVNARDREVVVTLPGEASGKEWQTVWGSGHLLAHGVMPRYGYTVLRADQ